MQQKKNFAWHEIRRNNYILQKSSFMFLSTFFKKIQDRHLKSIMSKKSSFAIKYWKGDKCLPFVAKADSIQKQQTKEWSDKEGWWCATQGLQTRTRSLAIISVASKSKNVAKAEGRQSVRALNNSREIAKRLPKTVESLHSWKIWATC